jgi:tetratricopeptide (TPR) repeat protein
MRAVTETNLGSALQADGRLDDAIDHYHRAVAFAPDFPPAYNNLASALRAKGQVADAISTYHQALRLRPQYPEAEYNLANALLDAGKPAEAIDHFQISLQTIPASVDVHNNLRIALMDQASATGAIANFAPLARIRLRSIAPQLARALGSAHRTAGDRALHRVAAQSADVVTLISAACWEMDRLDKAIAEFRASLKIAQVSTTLNNLGIALLGHGAGGGRSRSSNRRS